MRAKYYFNSSKLPLGPTNITDTPPESGEFRPSRGASVIFPGTYLSSGRAINVRENWQWDLVIEDSPIYNVLKSLGYDGDLINIQSAYGETLNSPISYSGQVLDIVFELMDGVVFKAGKRGYKVTMPVNRRS